MRSVSPYESRVLTVENDGATTAAYLRDAAGKTLGVCWITNHKKAPASLDLARLDTGRVPLMPLAHTRHRQGRKAFDPQALEVIWFEAGDGAAVLESGKPLCVIPGWSDIDRGIAGYSRDVVGRTPFACSLSEGAAELAPLIERARAHWDRQRDSNDWPEFQQAILGHLLARLGPGGYWWGDVGGRRLPRIGVSERPAAGDRPYTVLSTVGMSYQRMPAGGQIVPGPPTLGPDANGPEPGAGLPEGDQAVRLVPTPGAPGTLDASGAPHASGPLDAARSLGVEPAGADQALTEPDRIELALATTLPSQRAGSIFRWLGPLPWRGLRALGPGSCLRWRREPGAFPLGAHWDAVIMVDDPEALGGPPAPDLSGLTLGEDRERVRWLWVVPITTDELQYAASQGPRALINRLARRSGDRLIAAGHPQEH